MEALKKDSVEENEACKKESVEDHLRESGREVIASIYICYCLKCFTNSGRTSKVSGNRERRRRRKTALTVVTKPSAQRRSDQKRKCCSGKTLVLGKTLVFGKTLWKTTLGQGGEHFRMVRKLCRSFCIGWGIYLEALRRYVRQTHE